MIIVDFVQLLCKPNYQADPKCEVVGLKTWAIPSEFNSACSLLCYFLMYTLYILCAVFKHLVHTCKWSFGIVTENLYAMMEITNCNAQGELSDKGSVSH